jgi:1-acyl-sn-glycerol-3-phosphate acyltransferase
MIRTAFTLLVFLTFTVICGVMGLLGALVGLKDGTGSIFDWAMRIWGMTATWASGVKVVVHGRENLDGAQHIIVSNHMSQHDILVLASVLKNLKFVAKNELARVPFFGKAAASVGTVYIERQNRKSSFDSYRQAAEKIRDGACVVVFAEGSRGFNYSLRPFKKGPFVLAVHVHAPIVPVVIHGTREVHPKGKIRVTAGRVDLHFLEPIPTEGLTYEDRNALAKTVYDRMAALLVSEYGVESPNWDPRKTPIARETNVID